MNNEALQYYRITQNAYKSLGQDDNPFMNLGIWPSNGIISAQTNLVLKVIENLYKPTNILELGPGWGGSRKLIYKQFPYANYVGINCSEEQIAFASKTNLEIPNTKYIKGYFEQIDVLEIQEMDTLIAIESILHVKDKSQVLKTCRELGMKQFAIADVCVEESDLISAYPLFNPSLKYSCSEHQYRKILYEFPDFEFHIKDISNIVFAGWSYALNRISPISYNGNPRILKQFQESYQCLNNLSQQKKVKYLIITGRKTIC